MLSVLSRQSCASWHCSTVCADSTAGDSTTPLLRKASSPHCKDVQCDRSQMFGHTGVYFMPPPPFCRPKSPPVNMASVLQKLDSDYHHMREKILAGVPLEKLPPLSVDSEKITTGARYTPAQVRLRLLTHISNI